MEKQIMLWKKFFTDIFILEFYMYFGLKYVYRFIHVQISSLLMNTFVISALIMGECCEIQPFCLL